MDTQTLNKLNEITSVGKWRDVEGYPNYMVNTDGEVLNKTNGKKLTHHINNGGYKFVRLRTNGKPKQLLVHRLVAIAFIPNHDNKPIVNHKDSNRGNPKKSNLEWATHKENSEHMVDNFGSTNQTMTILMDKMGDEICIFPSKKRCLKYIYKQFRIKYGYHEDEAIVCVDIEPYTELSPISRDGRVARLFKLNF
ncbi:NUMOD4 domain-containing protein [Virgibacillus salexigens]|uniref:NUMOD4 motif n=1 Tax=Virgibacillus massiliensis TaxID=1462526 RepID=A0A024QIE0_9BACI|nr:NUMOD4 domain-containing protein [Virgibacillus massiliensis]CDQ41950.1 NUMOD4 motif [Virgibacillus massiliensis]